jgi:hypothetical protein
MLALSHSLLPYASHNMMPLLNSDTTVQNLPGSGHCLTVQNTSSHKTAHGMLSAPHRPHKLPFEHCWGRISAVPLLTTAIGRPAISSNRPSYPNMVCCFQCCSWHLPLAVAPWHITVHCMQPTAFPSDTAPSTPTNHPPHVTPLPSNCSSANRSSYVCWSVQA